MKYIRTKDGKIIDCRFSKEEYEKNYPNTNVSYEKWFHFAFEKDVDYEIIKQADTIEELCDEFVGVDIETKTGCINAYSELDKVKAEMEHYDFQLGKDYEIYGAVWCEWGLKYVARMNPKGELELL